MQQGDLVWFDSGLGFMSPGIVIEVRHSPLVKVILNEDTNEKIQIPGKIVLSSREKLPEPHGVADMVQLKELHLGAILQNIMCRFEHDEIYTYIGSILLSVNPYKLIKDLYGNRAIEKYRERILGQESPHLYALANEAFVNISLKKEDQVIVVSGESGAGKTESTKLILQYLTSVSNQDSIGSSKIISDQLLESSPLLESFGNAKTLRNDNSSRFGKFMEIRVAENSIVGAQMKEYLLEKSRIVYQATNERNYHVFYEMLAGMNATQKAKYGLSNSNYFHYLNQGGRNAVCATKNDAEDFQRLISAMDVLTIPASEQESIFSILSAVLHLGNVAFKDSPSDDGIAVKEMQSVEVVAYLLKVNANGLLEDITYRVTETRDEKIFSPLTVDEALEARDSISKALYAQLFSWLVQKVNKLIGKSVTATSVNLLDIFGFEVFPKNSFEQLCINFANESLQQLFIKSIFKTEQTEYQRERIQWKPMAYTDNVECIELLNKKHSGILHILDDQSNFPQATDHLFVERLCQVHSEHSAFRVDRLRSLQFCVKHYAGEVNYSCDGWLEKNRDRLRFETLSLLVSSSHSLVVEIFSEMHAIELERTVGRRNGSEFVKVAQSQVTKDSSATPTGTRGASSKRKAPTVAAKFQSSLSNLIAAIGHCNPYFVRCIKPNNNKNSTEFDRQLVASQLNYLGVLETIKIRKLGYPIRMYFITFLNRYRCLMNNIFSSSGARNLQARELCEVFLKGLSDPFSSEFQLGVSKVFMRENLERHLETERSNLIWNAATRLQSWVRGILLRRRFLKMRKSVIVLQKYLRRYIAKQKFLRYKWAVTRLQAHQRRKQTQQEFLTLRTRHRIKLQQDAMRALDAAVFSANDVNVAQNAVPKKPRVFNVPRSLTDILRIGTLWSPLEESKFERLDHHRVASRKHNFRLPERLDNFALSKYTMVALKGDMTWGESRDPIQTPYHTNIHESQNQMVEDLNKVLLFAIYEESLTADRFKVACAYLIHIIQLDPSLRDEAYIQICSQSWKMKSLALQRRIWLLMCAMLDCVPPSQQFAKYLLKYVSDYAFNGYKSICQQKILKCTIIGSDITRNGPITSLEWLANEQQVSSAIEICFMDSSSHLAQTDSWDTCEDVTRHLMKHLGLPEGNCSGWSLTVQHDDSFDSQVEDGFDFSFVDLPGYEFVHDQIAKYEYGRSFLKPKWNPGCRNQSNEDDAKKAKPVRSELKDSAVVESYPPADYENADKIKKYTFLSESYTQPNPDESSFWNSSMDQTTFIGGATGVDLAIRGTEMPDYSRKTNSVFTRENLRQDLVQKLLKAIRGQELPDKSSENDAMESNVASPLESSLLDELRGDVQSSSQATKKPPAPPPPPPPISQSIKVLSSDNLASHNEDKEKEEQTLKPSQAKNSIKFLKERNSGHVFKVVDEFTKQGLILTGRGLGEVIREKQLRNHNSVERTPQKKAVVPNSVTNSLLVPPVPRLFLDGSNDFEVDNGSRENSARHLPLTPRAAEVRRIMHERASMYEGIQDASSQLLAELRSLPNRSKENGQMQSAEEEDENLVFADSETGFRVDTPPPPPILPQFTLSVPHPPFVKNSQPAKSFDNSSDEAGAIPLSILEKVAPPVAFAGGTQTISANRKSMFHKDLAAQKEAQSHEEAIRLLKRNSFLIQNPQKPVRRESSRDQKSMLVLQSSGVVASAYIDDKTKKVNTLSSEKYAADFTDAAISRLPPSEAVKREQEKLQILEQQRKKLNDILTKKGNVGIAWESLESTNETAQIKPSQKLPQVNNNLAHGPTRSTQAHNASSLVKNGQTSDQLASIQVGKVSSAVKRLDSVLREQNSSERPDILARPINSENYRENMPMTVSKFISDERVKTNLFPVIKGQFLKYKRPSWKFTARKEMFSPCEKIENPRFKALIFHQVICDVFASCGARIKSQEQSEMIHYLTKNGVQNSSDVGNVAVDVRDWVIATSKNWKLYFSRFYPVVVIQDSLKIGNRSLNFTHIAVSHSSVKLVTQHSSSKDMEILMELYYSNIETVQYNPKTLQIFIQHNHNPRMNISAFTEQGQYLKDLIEKYKTELENSSRSYVKATHSHESKVIGQLQFKKEDLIKVVDEFPLQPMLLGEIKGITGQVPKSKVMTYTPEPLRHDMSLPELQMELHDDGSSVISSTESSSYMSLEEIPTVPKNSMLEFATIYFREKEPKLFGKSKIVGSSVQRLANRLNYSRQPIKSSLINLSSISDNLLAVQSFRNMQRFVGDVHMKGKSDYNLIYFVMKVARESTELSDEIYCQIIKQTTKNNCVKKDGVFKYWKLFALLAAYYPCSNQLKPYLFRYLNYPPFPEYPHPNHLSNLVLQNLTKTFKYGGRRELPAADEMLAFCENRSCKRQCFVLPGKILKNVKLFTATLVSEAVTSLASQIGILNANVAQQFGVAVSLEKDNHLLPLDANDYILDVTTKYSNQNVDYKFVFLRLFWISPASELPLEAIKVVFRQIMATYRDGNLIIVHPEKKMTEQQIDILSKLLAIELRIFEPELKMITTHEVKTYLPKFVQHKTDSGDDEEVHSKQWVNQINRHLTLAHKLSVEEAYNFFLESVSNSPLFGAALYPASSSNHDNCFISVTKAGVRLLSEHKSHIDFIELDTISSIRPINTNNGMYLDINHGNYLRTTTNRFKTKFAEEVKQFVHGYQDRLGITLRAKQNVRS